MDIRKTICFRCRCSTLTDVFEIPVGLETICVRMCDLCCEDFLEMLGLLETKIEKPTQKHATNDVNGCSV